MELSSDNLKELTEKAELAEMMQRTADKLRSSTATMTIRSTDLNRSDESEARFEPCIELDSESDLVSSKTKLDEFGKLQQDFKIAVADLLEKYSEKFKAQVKKQLKAKK